MAMVYQIVNKTTGDSYVGSTLGFPFGRWIEHTSLLSRGIHHSAKFQAAWDASMHRIEDWSFHVLESGIGLDFRFGREQYWFERIAPTLNSTSRITRIMDRHRVERQASEMLDAGVPYRTIATTVGCSIGWLTAFKRRRIVCPL